MLYSGIEGHRLETDAARTGRRFRTFKDKYPLRYFPDMVFNLKGFASQFSRLTF
jgi:hypothetical protein